MKRASGEHLRYPEYGTGEQGADKKWISDVGVSVVNGLDVDRSMWILSEMLGI